LEKVLYPAKAAQLGELPLRDVSSRDPDTEQFGEGIRRLYIRFYISCSGDRYITNE
jgi:hypothetical protein